MKQPNLFDYATSELSQDAFLCWLLAWANQKDNSPLKNMAIDFIKLMFDLHDKFFASDELKDIVIRQQYKHIDVLLELIFPKHRQYIIIEDKVHSGPHSNQLQRYMDSLQSEIKPEDDIIGIYFKTGFIFDFDIMAIKQLPSTYPYKMITRVQMLDLMEKYINDITSDIFHDYYYYLKTIDYTYQRMSSILESNLFKQNELEEVLQSREGQWILMKKIFTPLSSSEHSFYNGLNPDGSPWTQIKFLSTNEINVLPDKLFYRIDKRKGGYYLSLRQYLNYNHHHTIKKFKPKTEEHILAEKRQRLKKLRDCFKLACIQQSENEGTLTAGKVSQRGKKESEIGVFFFNEDNPLEKFYNDIPVFHEKFIKLVKREFEI